MRGWAVLMALGAMGVVPALAQEQVHTQEGTGAVLRALDMVTQELTDLDIPAGQSARFRNMTVTVKECRFPVDNPEGDAFAYVTIRKQGQNLDKFAGWMVASSPALSAMDDPRYDIWVLRCSRPSAETEASD